MNIVKVDDVFCINTTIFPRSTKKSDNTCKHSFTKATRFATASITSAQIGFTVVTQASLASSKISAFNQDHLHPKADTI